MTGCAQQPLVPVRVSTPSGEVIEGGNLMSARGSATCPSPVCQPYPATLCFAMSASVSSESNPPSEALAPNQNVFSVLEYPALLSGHMVVACGGGLVLSSKVVHHPSPLQPASWNGSQLA